MTDIVKRLTAKDNLTSVINTCTCKPGRHPADLSDLMKEAASEITRLRAGKNDMTDDLTISYQLGVEDMRSRLHKQADEIERLRAENEKLREALKPFADAVTDEYSWKYDINSADFRAAAADIRESGE